MTAQNFWKCHIIDNSSSGADGVKLADIDGDGLQDLVVGWEEGGLTKLYLHPVQSAVKEQWPSVILGNTPNVEDAVFADMTNDGSWEVVSCMEGESKKINIHTNLGPGILRADSWKQETLPASEGVMMWMYAEPLQVNNMDGVDLVAAGKNDSAGIGWFEAPEDPSNFSGWQWHEISPVGWVMSIIHRDMDGDGDMDIILSDRKGKLQGCRWLENPGMAQAQKRAWQNHFIGSRNKEIMFMAMADIDRDGKEEVITCERQTQTISIFKRLNLGGTRWQERMVQIPSHTGAAKSVAVGDIDRDGTMDIILSTNTNEREISGLMWLSGKVRSPVDSDWQPVSAKHTAKYDKAELLDIDKDGDLDILICEENYGSDSRGLGLVWYENPTVE